MKLNRFFKTFTAAILAFAMVLTLSSAVQVEAASFTAASAKKMKTITKVGTHQIVVPANESENYVQFKAPKAGTYTFNFKGVLYDNEIEDMESGVYFEAEEPAFMSRVEVAPIVSKKIKEQFSLVNTHTIYSMVALMNEMTLPELLAVVDEQELSLSDITDIADNLELGVELTHSYKVKLKKGQKIQFVFVNAYAAANGNQQNVTLEIKKK